MSLASASGWTVGVLPLFWQKFLTGRGNAPRLMGDEAEEWTAAELTKLDDLRAPED
jgi:hypothetical protein